MSRQFKVCFYTGLTTLIGFPHPKTIFIRKAKSVEIRKSIPVAQTFPKTSLFMIEDLLSN